MNKFIFTGAAMIVAYLAGRYSVPEKVEVDKKYELKQVIAQDETRKMNQVQRIIETTKPDGTKVKDTRIKIRRESGKVTYTKADARVEEKTKIENRRGVTVAILAGVPLTNLAYGVSVSKQFLGPLTFGAWGFTDLRVGLSLGMEF